MTRTWREAWTVYVAAIGLLVWYDGRGLEGFWVRTLVSAVGFVVFVLALDVRYRLSAERTS